MSGSATNEFGGLICSPAVVEGILIVEINYRLNIFGFLATESLSEEQNGFSGNYGIQDQIFALRWVQENIINFSTPIHPFIN